MKRYIFLLILLAGILSSSHLQASKFGIGFILGWPSGLTGKVFLNSNNAIDIKVGVVSSDLYISCDYARHFYSLFSLRNLPIFFGLGGGVQPSRSVA